MKLRSEYKSSFYCYGGYSFLVSWQTKNDICNIETKNREEALELCADLKSKHAATCHMIDCVTGRTIKKLA